MIGSQFNEEVEKDVRRIYFYGKKALQKPNATNLNFFVGILNDYIENNGYVNKRLEIFLKTFCESKGLFRWINESIINTGTLTDDMRLFFRIFYRFGLFGENIRFMQFPNRKWELIAINPEIYGKILKIKKTDCKKDNGVTRRSLKLVIEVLNGSDLEKRPHYILTNPIRQVTSKVGRWNKSLDCIPPDLVGKRLIFRNINSFHYKKNYGYESSVFNRSGRICNRFEHEFLRKVTFNLSKRTKQRFFCELKKQLTVMIPGIKCNNSVVLSTNMYLLKIKEEELLKSAITVYWDMYKYAGSTVKEITVKRADKELTKFYNQIRVLPKGTTLPSRNLKFLITFSPLRFSLQNFFRRILSTKVDTLQKAFDLLNEPRKKHMYSTGIFIDSNFVLDKIGIIVNPLSREYFMREDKNDGITSYVLAVFKNQVFIEILNELLKGKIDFTLAKHIVVEYTGQKRVTSYSAIYEDGIIIGKDINGIEKRISLLVKRTDNRDFIKTLIDWLKVAHEPNCNIKYMLVDVTHPYDLELSEIDSEISNIIIKEECGLINIGFFEGFKGIKFLGQIYNALDISRRKKVRNPIIHAHMKLKSFGLDIPLAVIKDFDRLFIESKVPQGLRNASHSDVLLFLKNWAKKYRREYSFGDNQSN